MSHTKNSPQQHRRIVRIPSGGTAHNSSTAARASPGAHSSISSLPNALVGVDYRNTSSDVQALENNSNNSSYRWQPARGGGGGVGSPSPTWPNVNTSESSAGYGSPALDTISAVYSEILDSSIRNAEGGQPQRFSPAVASALSGGSPEFGFVAARSPSVGAPLASSSAPLSLQAWNSSARDLGNSLSHAVELSKAGFALPGALAGNTVRSPAIAANAAQSSAARFSASPGLNFVERAARFSSFGNGSLSPSPFSLTENGNARALASIESGMAVSSNGGVSRSKDLGQESLGRNPGAYHIASADQRVATGAKENLGRIEQTRVFAAATGSVRSEWDGGEEEEGNAEKRERGSSDYEDSESSPEQQETSYGGESGAATPLVRKRRKRSKEQERLENESSSSSKERKGVDGSSKRFKDSRGGVGKEESKEKGEGANAKKSTTSNSVATSKDATKNAEQPPKLDYIHVRARRGQATDSHSLAERVRREKISERMKFLQDLVPGCSKVTGKAGMLDEIINYVQSIQRQVEFLSMKLASVAPKPDFNPEVVLNKHLPMGSAYGHTDLLDHSEKSLPLTPAEPQQVLQVPSRVNSLDFQPATTDRNVWRTNDASVSLPRNPVHAFHVGGSTPQTPARWDGDLQSVVQMGFGQGTHVGYRQSGHQSDFPPRRMT